MSRHARRLSLSLIALPAGAALAIGLPALAPGDAAPPATGSFTAVDLAWQVTGDAASSSVTIAKGGTVTFGYPAGRTRHNADFTGGPMPASCTQTAGTQGGTPPPLPTVPTAAGWSGTCRFDTPGTYAFHCDMHPTLMHGTIVVVDPNAPPPSTTTRSTGTTSVPPPSRTTTTAGGGTTSPGDTTPTGTTGTTGTPAGRAAPLRAGVSIAHVQRGTIVRGVAIAPAAGTRIDVTAFASNRVLGTRRPRHVRQVRVGARRVRATAAGRTSFGLTLDAAARSALRRRHSLTIALRVVVTAPGARAVLRTATVVVRLPLSKPKPAPGGYAY